MDKKFLVKPLVYSLCMAIFVSSTGCSTLTGIPSHGGGKRFAIEQRMVSASIRSTLMKIDVSSLKGQKVAIVFDLISDEGGGTLSGGRMNILAGLSSSYVISPVSTTSSQFQLYNLNEIGSNYSNTATGGNSVVAGSSNIVSNSNGSNSQNAQSTSSANSTSNSTDTVNSSGTQSGTNNIGAVTNTQSSSTTGNTTTQANTVQTQVGSSQTNSTTQPFSTTTENGAMTTTTNVGGSSTSINNSGSSIAINNPAVTTTTTTNGVTTTQNTLANQATQTTQPTTTTQSTNPTTNVQTTNAYNVTTNTGAVQSSTSNTGYTTTVNNPQINGSSSATTNSTGSTSASTNTSTGNSTNTSTSTGSSSGSQNTTANQTTNGTNTSNGTQNSTSNSTEATTGSAKTDGETKVKREVLTAAPVATQTQTKGNEQRATIGMQYQGLGDYQNFNVPKSDASLLMGLVRNYLLLNGVQPTVPTDPEATVILYVTVDVFGIVRSRFDALLFNRESVIAETAIEMMAFDRSGQMIMRPVNANKEAKYDENYLLWTGPYVSREKVREGKGLLINFSEVDGTKPTYPSDASRVTNTNNAQ